MNKWQRIYSVPRGEEVLVVTRCRITGIREIKMAEFQFGSYIRVRVNGVSKSLALWSEDFLCWQPKPSLPEEGEFNG